MIKNLEFFCIACGALLLVIWPISGTIAFRNILLFLGCLTSLGWIFCVRPKISIRLVTIIIFLLAIPLWMWLLYLFIPTDTIAQRYDLMGTWLRVILAIIMAFGLGLMLRENSFFKLGLFTIWSLLAITFFIWFLCDAWYSQSLLLHDFRAFFKYKMAVVYFLVWPCLFSYSILHGFYLNINFLSNLKIKIPFSVSAAVLILIICWIDFLVARSLNGIIMAGIVGIVLLILIFFKKIRGHNFERNHRLLTVCIICAIFIPFFTYIQYDRIYDKKFIYLFNDMQIAIQIEKYSSWERDPTLGGAKNPSDERGRIVHESTYERTAWFAKGLQLLNEHPLGAGFTNLPFRYYMLQENPNSNVTKTHSGWLDFALGVGIPGLVALWLVIAIVIQHSIKIIVNRSGANQIKSTALLVIWTLAGIWLAWWPGEFSEREFIEHLFFMVTLFGSLILSYKIKHDSIK
jgi:hypothetical protein